MNANARYLKEDENLCGDSNNKKKKRSRTMEWEMNKNEHEKNKINSNIRIRQTHTQTLSHVRKWNGTRRCQNKIEYGQAHSERSMDIWTATRSRSKFKRTPFFSKLLHTVWYFFAGFKWLRLFGDGRSKRSRCYLFVPCLEDGYEQVDLRSWPHHSSFPEYVNLSTFIGHRWVK